MSNSSTATHTVEPVNASPLSAVTTSNKTDLLLARLYGEFNKISKAALESTLQGEEIKGTVKVAVAALASIPIVIALIQKTDDDFEVQMTIGKKVRITKSEAGKTWDVTLVQS